MNKHQRKALLIGLGVVVASYMVRSVALTAMRIAYNHQQAVRAVQQRHKQQAKAPAPAATPAVPDSPERGAAASTVTVNPPAQSLPSPPAPLSEQVVPSPAAPVPVLPTPSPVNSSVAAATGTPPGPAPSPTLPPVPVPADGSVQSPDPSLVKLAGRWTGRTTLPQRESICTLRLEVRQDVALQYSGYSTLVCAPINPAALRSQKAHTSDSITDFVLSSQNPTSAMLTGTAGADAIRFRVDKNIGVAETVNACNMTSLSITPFGTGQAAVEWHEEAPCKGAQMVLQRTGP